MKILFCKTGYMKYYKGVTQKDQLTNGGSWVQQNKNGGETHNFDAVRITATEKPAPVCCGFVETKSTNRETVNQMHIERIAPGALDSVDDVLVVWCALKEQNMPVVVGWYQNAEVFRNYQNAFIKDTDKSAYYNVLAEKENCVLLPPDERENWIVPTAKQNGFGFGSSLVWYANEDEAQDYVENLVSRIQNYQGQNYIDIDETNDPVNQKRISIFDD